MAERCSVIMAGGMGTRLHPVSTPERPKPFLPLAGDQTLLEDTFDLCLEFTPNNRVYAVVSDKHVGMARELAEGKGMDPSNIIGEPYGKGTAACAALAVAIALGHGDDTVLALIPADQWVGEPSEFKACMGLAAESALRGSLCVFGVVPTGPETRYGYIGTDGDWTSGKVSRVTGFVEKPDGVEAETLVSSGMYLWNCGVSAMTAKVGAWNFQARMGIGMELLRMVGNGLRRGDASGISTLYDAMPHVSFDKAILENPCSPLEVVPATFPWSDVGTPEAVERLPGGVERYAALRRGILDRSD